MYIYTKTIIVLSCIVIKLKSLKSNTEDLVSGLTEGAARAFNPPCSRWYRRYPNLRLHRCGLHSGCHVHGHAGGGAANPLNPNLQAVAGAGAAVASLTAMVAVAGVGGGDDLTWCSSGWLLRRVQV